MEREAEPSAFLRAWRYLNYNPTAKWAALLSGVGLGLLYIALLGCLWLFAELMVNRGQIPSFQDLSRLDQEKFRLWWAALPEDEQSNLVKAVGLVPDESWKELAEPSYDPRKLLPLRQELAWRAYLYRTLREKVSGSASVLVLPAFRDLRPIDQEAFEKEWSARTRDERLAALEPVGFPDEDRTTLADAEIANARPDVQEILWRVHRMTRLHETDPIAADYLKLRLANEIATLPEQVMMPASRMDDRGTLSLVVRTHVRNNLVPPDAGVLARFNPYAIVSTMQGFLAWLNPWTWKYGTPARPNYFIVLTGLLGVVLALALLRAILGFVLHDMAARATIEAATRLRRAVYHHTFRLGTLAFRTLGPGEAVTVFTRHIEAVHDALYVRLTVLIPQPIKFGLLLAFALVIHPLLAAACLMFALLAWLVGGQIASYFRREGRLATHRASEQLTLIRESLMLMRLVKCYLMELFNQSRVERQLARHSAAQRRRYRGEAIYYPLLVFFGMLASAVLLYVTGLIVLNGQLSVASAIAMTTALASLYFPLSRWLENRRIMRRGRESAEVLFKFLERPGEVGQVVGAEFLQPMSKEMEFDGVTLREPGTGRVLLQDVSLTIRAGQRVGIVGLEDVEKHALVYLLPRFLDPSSGEIRIDQHNLRWVTLDSLRAQIAIVMQHNLVFHDTVANNIGCGDPAYTLPQIIDAAKSARAHHFIQKLPKGYETTIGELGHRLTISQQFRIALARAILRDPAILIIEEPESQLDDETKELLDDTFSRILPGRTAIFLPHRVSTLKSCDRIFVLHRGRLEASGDHRLLLAQNSLYRRLHYLEYSDLAEPV